MEHVQAGHGKVEDEEKLGRRRVAAGEMEAAAGNEVLHELGVIFAALDAEEGRAEKPGGGVEREQCGTAPGAREIDGQRHGESAQEEHGGVEAAEIPFLVPAGFRERLPVGEAINHVAGEHAAEEEHFGGEEDPHAEQGARALVRRFLEGEVERLVGRLEVSFRGHAAPPRGANRARACRAANRRRRGGR